MAPDTHSSSAAVAAIADVDGAGMAMPGGGQAVLVIREYGAPDDEDEFEATPQAELLDPACRDVYNSYLWQYGEMLFAWGLLEQRNELFKFLKFVQPFNALAVEASADTRLACDKCGQETKPGVRQHHQRHPPHTCLGCGAGVPGIRCVLCRTIVKGMILTVRLDAGANAGSRNKNGAEPLAGF
ncbi:hypothetical protein BC831DRAFT_513701 [Entophlyctis helioformis]|nr:hypothetical protein BC831DRAFT_513701 [Entophlyctis helioformis]